MQCTHDVNALLLPWRGSGAANNWPCGVRKKGGGHVRMFERGDNFEGVNFACLGCGGKKMRAEFHCRSNCPVGCGAISYVNILYIIRNNLVVKYLIGKCCAVGVCFVPDLVPSTLSNTLAWCTHFTVVTSYRGVS